MSAKRLAVSAEADVIATEAFKVSKLTQILGTDLLMNIMRMLPLQSFTRLCQVSRVFRAVGNRDAAKYQHVKMSLALARHPELWRRFITPLARRLTFSHEFITHVSECGGDGVYETQMQRDLEKLDLPLLIHFEIDHAPSLHSSWAFSTAFAAIRPTITHLNLTLSHNVMNVPAALAICITPCLTHLDLSTSKFDDYSLDCLKVCPGLLELNIGGCEGLNGRCWSNICSLKNLKQLFMSRRHNFRDGDLKAILAACPDLTELDISEAHLLTSACLSWFASRPMHWLDVSGTDLVEPRCWYDVDASNCLANAGLLRQAHTGVQLYSTFCVDYTCVRQFDKQVKTLLLHIYEEDALVYRYGPKTPDLLILCKCRALKDEWCKCVANYV